MAETDTDPLHLRCPKCQNQQQYARSDYKGKRSLLFVCAKCGHSQKVMLPREDVNQAAARIIREAIERD